MAVKTIEFHRILILYSVKDSDVNGSFLMASKQKLHWPGIEPVPPAWQAKILPLNHRCLHKGTFEHHTFTFVRSIGGDILKQLVEILQFYTFVKIHKLAPCSIQNKI